MVQYAGLLVSPGLVNWTQSDGVCQLLKIQIFFELLWVYHFWAFSTERYEATLDLTLVVVRASNLVRRSVYQDDVRLVVCLDELEGQEIFHWCHTEDSRIFNAFQKCLVLGEPHLILIVKLARPWLHLHI